LSIAAKSLLAGIWDGRAGSGVRSRRFGSAGQTSERLAFATAAVLLPAAILPPIVLVAIPEMLAPIEWRTAIVSVFGVLLLLPGLVGLAAMRIGLRRLAHVFHAVPDGDRGLAVWRIFAGLLLFFYALGLPRLPSQEGFGSYCLIVAVAGLIGGWLLLLLAVLRPMAPVRRFCGIGSDAALLSAFLHFGGGPAAASYPFYFLLIVYTGWRFGTGALIVASLLSVVGFAVVVASTEFWRDLPLLSGGLIGALVIVPTAAAALLRAVTASEQNAAAAAALQRRALSAVGGALRQALTTAEPAGDSHHDTATIKELRGQLQDADDLLSVAAGSFSLQPQRFDLHALVNEALASLRRDATQRGVRFTTRIDPALPFQLCGPWQQLGRLLHNLAALAIARSEGSPVRLSVDALPIDERGMRLCLAIPGDAVTLQPDDPTFLVVEHLAALTGGEIVITEHESHSQRMSVIVPVTVDQTVPDTFDIGDRPVFIVSDDSQFASGFAEPGSVWCANIRWIGGYEAALCYLMRSAMPTRPVLIVDARTNPLPALSFVHRAGAEAGAPFILLIAAAEQIVRISELTEGSVDNVLAATASAALVRNALHALPLDEASPADIETAPPASDDSVGPQVVTPITAHPRFVADPADAVDAATIDSLRALGGDDDFLDELVANFREEMRPIIENIGRAAAKTDIAGFYAALDALRRCAGSVGGARLYEAALALRRISGDELRQRGRDHVDQLATELARLDAALTELLVTPQALRQ
jgi:signal transduction histidine kinase